MATSQSLMYKENNNWRWRDNYLVKAIRDSSRGIVALAMYKENNTRRRDDGALYKENNTRRRDDNNLIKVTSTLYKENNLNRHRASKDYRKMIVAIGAKWV